MNDFNSDTYEARGEFTRIKDISIWNLGGGIIEVVVDEGVDAGKEHLEEIIAFTEKMNPHPKGILINRENDYSLKFSLFTVVKDVKYFQAAAMVNNNRKKQFFVENLLPDFLRFSVFNDRKEALIWLKKMLD